ncbi:MAG: arylesterase [Gammaproteobacteria bacterium]
MNTRLPALLLAAVVLCGCGDAGPRLPRLAPEAVVLAFGNSLTRGTGAGARQSYPAVLAELIGREVVNAGVPGELSAAGRARLGAVLERVEPALLILCHGGNDMLRKRDLGQARANIEAMIAMARERGVAVLLLGVPRPGLWLGTAEFYDEIAQATATPLERDAITDILGDAGLKSDPIHPNAAGYRRLAEAVAARLEELGAL